MLIPWPICTAVDGIAWLFGYQTTVMATSGRWGATSIHFIRRHPGAKRLPRLRPFKKNAARSGWIQ